MSEIRERMYAAWDPANDKESMQLEIVIAQFMNLRRGRAERFEVNFLDTAMAVRERQLGEPEQVGWNDDLACAILMGGQEHERNFKLIDRYTRRAHKLYNDAVRLLEAMQKERRKLEKSIQPPATKQTSTTRKKVVPIAPPESELASFCNESTTPGQPKEIVPRR